MRKDPSCPIHLRDSRVGGLSGAPEKPQSPATDTGKPRWGPSYQLPTLLADLDFKPHSQQHRLWGLLGLLVSGRNALPLLRLLRDDPDTHMLQAWLDLYLGLLTSGVVQSSCMPHGHCVSRSVNLPVSTIHLPQPSGLLGKVLNLPGVRSSSGANQEPLTLVGLDLIFYLASGVA